MAGQNKKIESSNIQRPKISIPVKISYYVDICGVGGLIKTGLAFVAWLILLFSHDNIDLLIWSTVILNTPCLIDVIDLKAVPPNVHTKIFHVFRGCLILLLLVTVLFSLFLWGAPANIKDFTIDNTVSEWILKASILLSVIGTGFCYGGKIYTEKF